MAGNVRGLIGHWALRHAAGVSGMEWSIVGGVRLRPDGKEQPAGTRKKIRDHDEQQQCDIILTERTMFLHTLMTVNWLVSMFAIACSSIMPSVK